MEELTNQRISDIVKADYRAARVFRKHGINYCCAGAVTLSAACEIRDLAPETLVRELREAGQDLRISNELNFEEWKLSFLVDYIAHVHHGYLRNALPSLSGQLQSFVSGHARKMPWLPGLLVQFTQLSEVLDRHMEEQEKSSFPYIRHLDGAYSGNEPYGALFVRTLRKPLNTAAETDAVALMIFEKIRQLTSGYRLPERACTTHHVVFSMLEELDRDFSQHQHLEQSYLLPRAASVELQLLNR